MKKSFKILLISIICILIIITGAFFAYTSVYYKADDIAINVMQSQGSISEEDDYIVLSSTVPSEKALIFYPGAKVEYTAYLPILEKVNKNTGITCILVKMPFNMAIFGSDKADEIIEKNSHIETWYMAGHSMGGAMASDYASKNKDKVDGLILLGSYIYGDYSEEDTLTIYGTFNTTVSDKINYTKNIIAIEGGNHAQFGNYGKQKGDAEATISREEQQDIAVEEIKQFIDNR